MPGTSATSTTMASRLHYRAGELAAGPLELDLRREKAGWRYSSLRVLALGPAGSVELSTGDEEWVVLSLGGSAELVSGEDEATLVGRRDVFAGPSDLCYLPPGRSLRIMSASGGRFALAGARASGGLPFTYRPAESLSVEVRGAGACSRQVVHYAMGEALAAERLLCCEVLTPAGNWSSFPPHKHDEALSGESELEEIYYFEIAADAAGRRGVAYQRCYGTPGRPIDLVAEVGHGDVVLIPHGYHGPSMAMPGYDLYYLNVMAGPGPRRWLASDDPAYHWVRERWQQERVDPRLDPGGRLDHGGAER